MQRDKASKKCHVVGLSHLLLQVSDIELAEHFYIDLLGLEVKKRSMFDEERPLIVTKQGLGLTLLPSSPAAPAPPENQNLEHFAFLIEGIEYLEKIFKEEGYITKGPKATEYGKSLYVLDPDGYRVECIEQT